MKVKTLEIRYNSSSEKIVKLNMSMNNWCRRKFAYVYVQVSTASKYKSIKVKTRLRYERSFGELLSSLKRRDVIETRDGASSLPDDEVGY